MVNSKKEKKLDGVWRSKAGRRPERVPRRHKTFWVSEAEIWVITEYLLRNRANDPVDEEE